MADKKPLIYEPRVPELPSAPFPVIQAPQMPELPQLVDPRVVPPYKPQKTAILDYNDPYQINSIADIIVGSFNNQMQRKPFYIGDINISDIPILNIIPSTFQYVNDAYVQPIKGGHWGAVGLNTLTNFSETLDLLANPVKGLILEGKEGFKDALGLGGVGRKNYDYNTGNFVADMALELVSDPLNWFTLFGKGAVSAGVKYAAAKGLKEVGDEVGQEMADKAYKQVAKVIAKKVMEGSDKSMADLAQEAAQFVMKQKGHAPIEFTEAFLKNLNKFSMDDTTVQILKGVNSVIKPMEALDDSLFKAGLGVPYAAGYLMKKAGEPVWQFLHSNYVRGLKPYMTPSGNLDILRYEDVLNYSHKFDGTAKVIHDTKLPTEQIQKIYFQEAILKESGRIQEFLQVTLKDFPHVNMEGKAKMFADFLTNEIGVPYEEVLKALQDLTYQQPGKYEWLYDWIRRSLDINQARLIDNRTAAWDLIKDLQGKLKGLKSNDSLYVYQYFEQYLAEHYKMTVPELLKQAADFEITLGPDFKWLDDYFQNSVSSLEKSGGYNSKHEIMQKLKGILDDPKKLEAESRYKLMNDFMKKEHGMDMSHYIARLKELDTKYPGIFTKYIKALEDSMNQLRYIDRLSRQYAMKEAAQNAVKQSNNLVQAQVDALSNFTNNVPDQISHFVSDFLEHSDPDDVRKGYGFNPEVYKTDVLEGEFNEVSLQEYMDTIHAQYNFFVDNIMQPLEKEELLNNDAYLNTVDGIRKVYEEYWQPLEDILRKQAIEHPDGFYDLAGVFKDFPHDINNAVLKGNMLLERYKKVIAKADVLNDNTVLENLLTKNAKEYEENLNQFLILGSDERLEKLSEHIIRLERKAVVTAGDFHTVQKDFIRDIQRFFFGDNPPTDIYEAIQTWVDSLNTMGKTIGVKQKVVTDTGIIEKEFQKVVAMQVPKIWAEAFIENFQDMFAALKAGHFPDFLDSVDSIMYNLTALSYQSKDAADILAPLREVFEKYDLGVYKPMQVNITGEGIWYHFKLEQDYVLTQMMANKELNDFIKALMNPEHELGIMLKNMMLTGNDDAIKLMDSLESYLNYREFLNNLYEYMGNPKMEKYPIDHDVLGAFTSTLQKYALRDPKTLLENLDNNFYYIIKQTEKQINSMEMPKKLNLDDLIKALENKTITKTITRQEQINALPATPQDYIRVFHYTRPENVESIKQNGLHYKGVIDTTVNIYDETGAANHMMGVRNFDAPVGTPWEHDIAIVFDIPYSEYRLHRNVSLAPETLPAKYFVGTVGPDISTAELKYSGFKNLEAHHALDDSIRTSLVCEDELEQEFKKLYGEDAIIIHSDIETTGLEDQMHQITEIGMYNHEQGLSKEFIVKDVEPGQARSHPATTIRNPNVDKELDALKGFMAELQKYDQAALEGRRIVINMHNGFEFDKRFILHRLEMQYHIAEGLKNTEDMNFCKNAIAQLTSGKYTFSDSLKMLQQKYGYTVISSEDRLSLYYALRNFVTKQQDMNKLLQPIDPSIAARLKGIGENMRDALLTSKVTPGADSVARYEKYFEAADSIYAFFNSVRRANQELSRTMFKKSIFDDDLFQKLFGVNITQVLGTRNGNILDGVRTYGVKTHLNADAIQEYFDAKVLSDFQMEFLTGLARDIDREYSQLRHTVRLKYYDKLMKDILTAFKEAALKSSKIPADLARIKVHADYLSNFAILRKLFSWKTTVFKDVIMNKQTLKDGSTFLRYADNILDGLTYKMIPDEFRMLLEHPEEFVYHKVFDETALRNAVDTERQAIWQAQELARQTHYAEKYADQKAVYQAEKDAYIQAQYKQYHDRAVASGIATEEDLEHRIDTVLNFEKKLKLNEALSNYEGYYRGIQETVHQATDLMDMLDNLGLNWDANGAERAVVQVRATTLKEIYTLLNEVSSRHSNIKDIQKQFHQVMKYREIYDGLARQQLEQFLRLTDDDLFAHLVNDARRCVILDGFELTGDQLKALLDRTENLKAKHISLTMLDDNKIYITLNKEVNLTTFTDDLGRIKHMADGQYIAPPKMSQLDVASLLDAIFKDEEDVNIKKSIQAVYDKFYKLVGDYDSEYSPHYGSTGELTDKAYYRGITNSKGAYTPGIYDSLPDEIKQLLPDPDIMYADEFFHGATFNHSVLGRAAFRQEYHQYTNFDIVSMLTHTMSVQAEHLKSHVEYMNMFFDNTMSINNGYIAKFTDDEILEALARSDEYRLVALVQDSKKGAMVVDINPKTTGDIKKARELGAVVMAYQTYSTAFGAINSYSMRHNKLNMLHKISYLFKAGYLLSPGTILRNVIDSVLKNYTAAADDPTGMTQSFLSAWQLYWRYRQTSKEIINFSTDTATKKARVTKESVEGFFNTGVSKLTKEQYDFIHGFDVDGPSGGEIKEWSDYLMHDKNYGTYGAVIQSINFMMEPNKVVEQVCRLAEYMWAIEKGMPTTKAYALIAKTHFDYALKNNVDRIIELLFPFYTFTMNNIHYWLDAFDRIPALASVLRDVYTPIWNFDDYTPEEMNYNRSLQYQILSGNMPLERMFGDAAHNMTLKLNPSFMDVYQLATDPVNAIKGKLSPVIQAGLNAAGAGLPEEMKYAYGINAPSDSMQNRMQAILDLLPIAGPIINRLFVQGPKYYERTGNPLNLVLPSIFGATADSKVYTGSTKQYYKSRTYVKKPRKGYARKAKRFFAKRMQKYYPKKVYSSVGYSIDNFYNRLYAKTGRNRLKSMSIPVTGQTLKYRIKDMFYYYK